VRTAAALQAFDFGVGLHCGEVLYGNIGTQHRLEFSVVGPAANETARIEALSKTTGHPVVVSETVVRHLAEDVEGPGRA
jgi:adenylate cyclase